MFGRQGMAQSNNCSMNAGTLCGAPIKVSYFVFMVYGYQIVQILQQAGQRKSVDLVLQILLATGMQVILMATVLCHEFGHGNMARYLGGQIDHILLWVFGGICFHTRPPGDRDNSKILRNDLMVVAAGPFTHFLQAPLWGCLLVGLFFLKSDDEYIMEHDPWEAFVNALNPFGGMYLPFALKETWGMWFWALFWMLVEEAIRLNVSLFIFNVFFPMYPADGAKLLVTSLMFFCGVPARTAALVLVCASVPCALLLIGWALSSVIGGITHGGGAASMLSGLMGWMGVMSLQEAWRIWQLRKARQLHTHPLFEVARSWQRSDRDEIGRVRRINNSDFDDEEPLTRGCAGRWGQWSCAGCLTCMLPCIMRPSPGAGGGVEQTLRPPPAAGATPTQQSAVLRDARAQLLNNIDAQQTRKQMTVRDLQEQAESPTAGGASSSRPEPAATA